MQNEMPSLRIGLVFLLISLLAASPFIVHFIKISEAYYSPEIRDTVLDSVFYVRETYGVAIADISIKDISQEGQFIHVVVHEDYHGFLEEGNYEYKRADYHLKYDKANDSMEVLKVEHW